MPVSINILIAYLAMTLVTIGLGFYALQGERILGDTALKMYDDAFMSVNFARSAQTKFERVKTIFAVAAARAEKTVVPVPSERQRLLAIARGENSNSAAIPASGPDGTMLHDAVGGVLDDLDVSIERAMLDGTRASAKQLRGKIAALTDSANTTAVEAMSAAFDDVIEGFAQDGYTFRQETGSQRDPASARDHDCHWRGHWCWPPAHHVARALDCPGAASRGSHCWRRRKWSSGQRDPVTAPSWSQRNSQAAARTIAYAEADPAERADCRGTCSQQASRADDARSAH